MAIKWCINYLIYDSSDRDMLDDKGGTKSSVILSKCNEILA
jgi:hypothetical protein